MSTGLKRKHHGEKKEERRGRPRKIDKERSLMSTPVTHVHVCTKKLCKCLVWRRFFLINLYVKMVLYITLCINFYSKKKKRINQFRQLYKIFYAHVCRTLVFLHIILLLKIQDTCPFKFKFYRFCLYFFIPCFTAPSAPSCGRPL